MDLKTRFVYWLIKILLSLLIDETGGKTPERITQRLKVGESDLQDACQYAHSMGDKERGKRYAAGMVNLWVIDFEVKQITRVKVKLPKIRVIWPAKELG
jgi:hypothetical protein